MPSVGMILQTCSTIAQIFDNVKCGYSGKIKGHNRHRE